MKKDPFDNLPYMSREEAFEILSSPESKLKLSSDYYKAIYHLLKFPGEDTNNALISILRSDSQQESIVIAKRKAVEVLSIHGCSKAIPLISSCLLSDDPYLQENAIIALQRLKFKDIGFVKKLDSLLKGNNQNRRIAIKTLASMGSKVSLNNIRKIIYDPYSSSIEKGAAVAAVYKLSGDSSELFRLEDNLFLANQNDRHCAVQDIIDTELIRFLPCLIQAPIAPSFKIRAINLLWPGEDLVLDKIDLIQTLDSIVIDNCNDIHVLHEYDNKPDNGFLIKELFSSDFSRCYLALQTISKIKSSEILPFLYESFSLIEKDYGALYFVNKLFFIYNDWDPNLLENIEIIALNCLDNKWPDQMKFKPAAILTLMKLKPFEHKEKLIDWIDDRKTFFWASRYAALISICFNAQNFSKDFISKLLDLGKKDSHRFVRLKSESISKKILIES